MVSKSIKNELTTFNETQWFAKNPLGMGIILLLISLFVYVVFIQDSSKEAIFFAVFFLGLPLLFILSIHLKILVDSNTIQMKFFPLFFEETFHKQNIENLQLIKYHPIRDFGGWGIRYGKNNIRAFNISGNRGLLVTLKNGEKILIGTKRAKDLQNVLREHKFQHSDNSFKI